MGPKKIVDFQGRKVIARSLDFTAKTGENWQQYELEDGSVLKVKAVVLDVTRLEGEYGAEGDPVYQFSAQQLVTVIVPDELKRKVN